MTTHRIAILPGNGVGVEVTAETRRILESLETLLPGLNLNFHTYPIGFVGSDDA